MVKTVEEIYQEMLSAYGEKTGVAPAEGCDLSARLYACAAQVFSLYVQAGWVARQAFPQTAEGEYLEPPRPAPGAGAEGAGGGAGCSPFCWRNFREYGPAHSSGDGLYDSRPDPL